MVRWVLNLGEKLGMTLADERIAISPIIANLILREYRKESHVVPNGVEIPKIQHTKKNLERFSLQSGKYVLFVSRL